MSVVNVLILVGSVAGSLIAIAGVLSWVVKALKRELIEVIDDRTKELRPNHGGSMKDILSAMDERLKKVERKRRFLFWW